MPWLPGSILESRDTEEQFKQFFVEAEPRLRRALVSRYGQQRGRDATAEALGWAWGELESFGTRRQQGRIPLPGRSEQDAPLKS